MEARLSNAKDRGGSRRKRKHSPDEVAGGAVAMSSPTDESASSSPIDPLSDLYAVLEGSALIPFLESKLQANSFLEICSHATVYRYVVHIIRELGKKMFLSVKTNFGEKHIFFPIGMLMNCNNYF